MNVKQVKELITLIERKENSIKKQEEKVEISKNELHSLQDDLRTLLEGGELPQEME